MAKKKSKRSEGGGKQRVTMQALRDLSSDEDESLPPESEWNDEAKALKEAIEKGAFDKLLEAKKAGDDDDDDESFEEVDLDDENDESGEEEEETRKPAAKKLQNESSENSEGSGDEESSEAGDEEEQVVEKQEESESESDNEEKDEEDEEQEAKDKAPTIEEKNSTKTKALQVVTESLIAEKRDWPWAETFDIVVENPLPFGGGRDTAAAAAGEALNIHDDLKREVAFYDTALEAVIVAKAKCQEAGIPFQRPDDFFAEMVKTDGTYLVTIRGVHTKPRFCSRPFLSLHS